MKEPIFLVTGGTGTIGGQVIKMLLKAPCKVRLLTRDPAAVKGAKGVEVIAGDLNQADTLKDALKGVKGLHLISFGDESYTPLANGGQLVQLAEQAGVERVTVLWNGEGNESSLETAIKRSSLDWIILQPQEYMANALGWVASVKHQAQVQEPFGDRPTAAIHEADVGAVIAEILLHGGHAKQIYTLTGPEVLTPKKQVQQIASALGRDIAFIELDEQQTRARWQEWGLPQATMDYLYQWYGNTPAQGFTITPTVEQIIGRPAKSFKAWVTENIRCFR